MTIFAVPDTVTDLSSSETATPRSPPLGEHCRAFITFLPNSLLQYNPRTQCAAPTIIINIFNNS